MTIGYMTSDLSIDIWFLCLWLYLRYFVACNYPDLITFYSKIKQSWVFNSNRSEANAFFRTTRKEYLRSLNLPEKHNFFVELLNIKYYSYQYFVLISISVEKKLIVEIYEYVRALFSNDARNLIFLLFVAKNRRKKNGYNY